MSESDAGRFFELGGKVGPELRRFPAPVGIALEAHALALHPDQAEIAACRAQRLVALVEQGDIDPRPGEAVGDCRPEQAAADHDDQAEEHTSELQSLMRISYAVFCLKKKTKHQHNMK